MKRFHSVNRTLESIFGALSGATNGATSGKHKVFNIGGKIPAHLRKNRKDKPK